MIDTAVEHGAPKILRQVVSASLTPATTAGPLLDVDRGALTHLVEHEATSVSKQWGRWVQPVDVKLDALRSPQWVVQHNPGFAQRAAHKGDLRCSILETLRRDLSDEPASEASLARWCGATVMAIRAALTDLECESPYLQVERRRGRGGSRIWLDQVV